MKRFYDVLFWLVMCGLGAALTSVILWASYDAGRMEGASAKDDEWRKREQCMCGETRSCPFGPGIVGKQRCTSLFGGGTEWSRCEPDPSCCKVSSP